MSRNILLLYSALGLAMWLLIFALFGWVGVVVTLALSFIYMAYEIHRAPIVEDDL